MPPKLILVEEVDETEIDLSVMHSDGAPTDLPPELPPELSITLNFGNEEVILDEEGEDFDFGKFTMK